MVTKGRSASSTRWLHRHLRDNYVRARHRDGYRSRSSYKLIEINNKYRIIRAGARVADLGAAPGGWTQVITKLVGDGGVVWAIDILPMQPVEGATCIRGDFTLLNDEISDRSLNVIVSDMAPNFSGDHKTEHFRSMRLCNGVLQFALKKLGSKGSLIMKIIVGGEEKELFNEVAKGFQRVCYFKPNASSSTSSEIYIVAMGRLGQNHV